MRRDFLFSKWCQLTDEGHEGWRTNLNSTYLVRECFRRELWFFSRRIFAAQTRAINEDVKDGWIMRCGVVVVCGVRMPCMLTVAELHWTVPWPATLLSQSFTICSSNPRV